MYTREELIEAIVEATKGQGKGRDANRVCTSGLSPKEIKARRKERDKARKDRRVGRGSGQGRNRK